VNLNLPVLLIGLLCLVAGIGLIVARTRIARANTAVLKGSLGKLGDRVSTGSKPWSIAGVGVIAILMGVGGNLGGIFGH
jgi:hypothetical protein